MGKYMNKLGIVFKNQNFHKQFFDSNADSDPRKLINSFKS